MYIVKIFNKINLFCLQQNCNKLRGEYKSCLDSLYTFYFFLHEHVETLGEGEDTFVETELGYSLSDILNTCNIPSPLANASTPKAVTRTSTSATTFTASTGEEVTEPSPEKQKKGYKPTLMEIGIGAGGIALLAIVLIGIWVLRKRSHAYQEVLGMESMEKINPTRDVYT